MQTIQDKLDKAEEYKSTGNAFFKEGNFSRAKANYGKCLAYCTGLPGSTRNKTGYESFQAVKPGTVVCTEEEDNAAAKLELISHQNIATCFLKMGSPSDALVHCEKALKLDKDGSAWKARMRKGEAYLQQGRHDDAKEIFEDLLQSITDENAVLSIKKLTIKANKLLKAHSAKEKMRYKNMFANSTESSMASEDNLKSESQDNGADTGGSS